MENVLSFISNLDTSIVLLSVTLITMMLSNIFLAFEKHHTSSILAFCAALFIAVDYLDVSTFSFWISVLVFFLVFANIILAVLIAVMSMLLTKKFRIERRKKDFRILSMLYYITLIWLALVCIFQ